MALPDDGPSVPVLILELLEPALFPGTCTPWEALNAETNYGTAVPEWTTPVKGSTDSWAPPSAPKRDKFQPIIPHGVSGEEYSCKRAIDFLPDTSSQVNSVLEQVSSVPEQEPSYSTLTDLSLLHQSDTLDQVASYFASPIQIDESAGAFGPSAAPEKKAAMTFKFNCRDYCKKHQVPCKLRQRDGRCEVGFKTEYKMKRHLGVSDSLCLI